MWYIYTYIYIYTYLFIHPTIYPSIHLFIHPYVYISDFPKMHFRTWNIVGAWQQIFSDIKWGNKCYMKYEFMSLHSLTSSALFFFIAFITTRHVFTCFTLTYVLASPHSSTLAWKIPWMEEPGRLQSMGSRRVGHNWATSLYFSLSSIGEGNGNPLQCSCLEDPRDGGAWWAAVYGVAQNRTQLKWLSSSSMYWLSECLPTFACKLLGGKFCGSFIQHCEFREGAQ